MDNGSINYQVRQPTLWQLDRGRNSTIEGSIVARSIRSMDNESMDNRHCSSLIKEGA